MYVERFTDVKGDLFIKFPLINNLINERKWRANEEANQRYVYTAVGKPLSLMFNKEESIFRDYHPFNPNASLSDASEHVDFARKYAIGEIVDVTPQSGSYKAASGEIPWFGIAKITDPVVAEELKKPTTRLVPPAFSPGIIQYAGTDDNITEYEIVHVAAVPSGAFGPKFITIDKCQGDLTTCSPQLKAASISYKERTGCCPITALSSYVAKSASSSNTMSYNSTTATTPSPGFTPNRTGEATVRSPVGDVMAQQNTMQSKPKPTIRIKRLNFSQSKEPNPSGEQPEEGGVEPNNGEQTDASSKATVQSVQKELTDLRKQYQTQASAWKQDTMRREISDAIPKSLFTDQNGRRFREKDWQKEVESRLQQGLPIETIREIYQLKVQMLEVPEIKRASSPYGELGSIPRYQSASSLESDEERIRAEKALRLNGGL